MKKSERLNNESLVKKNLEVELISESANVKDFGAAGDGVTDDTQAFKLAIENALSTNKKLHIPSGRYYLATVPPEGFKCWTYKTDRVPRTYSLNMYGDGCQNTQIIWEPQYEWGQLFERADFTIFSDFTITDYNNRTDTNTPDGWPSTYKGVIFATPLTKQSSHSTFSRIKIFGSFKYVYYTRFSVWDSFTDIYSAGALCHYCFAMGDGGQEIKFGTTITQEMREKAFKDPFTLTENAWNIATDKGGWFQNVVRMDMVSTDGGECGIYGALMGLTGSAISCQNTKANPVGTNKFLTNNLDLGVGIWLKGRNNSKLKSNSIAYYYTEGCQQSLKVEDCEYLSVEACFFQGSWENNNAVKTQHVRLWNSNVYIGGINVSSGKVQSCARLDGNSNLTFGNNPRFNAIPTTNGGFKYNIADGCRLILGQQLGQREEYTSNVPSN